MSSRSRELALQNEQVVTFTLVELLTQLVFVAMLLALVLRDEELKVNPGAEALRRLKLEIAARDQRIRDLETRNASLTEALANEQERVRALLGTKGTTLPFGVVAISQEEFDYFANLKAMLNAKQAEVAAANAKAAAAGATGVGRPICTVTAGFLLDIGLRADGGFAVVPAWAKGTRVEQVPGLSAFQSPVVMGPAEFGRAAAKLRDWGLREATPCTFRVIARRRHSNADRFERQLATLDGYFYVARRR